MGFISHYIYLTSLKSTLAWSLLVSIKTSKISALHACEIFKWSCMAKKKKLHLL